MVVKALTVEDAVIDGVPVPEPVAVPVALPVGVCEGVEVVPKLVLPVFLADMPAVSDGV